MQNSLLQRHATLHSISPIGLGRCSAMIVSRVFYLATCMYISLKCVQFSPHDYFRLLQCFLLFFPSDSRPGGSWSPEYLTMEHLPLLLNTSVHLFARKVHRVKSQLLLDALDRLRYGNLSHFLPRIIIALVLIPNLPSLLVCSIGVFNDFPSRTGVQLPISDDTCKDANHRRQDVPRENMKTNDGSSNSSSSNGVTSLQPQLPFLARLAAGDVDLVEDSLDWLLPLGMKHLQTVWDDERTHTHILESIETYITSVTTMSAGASDSTSSFNPTPLQLLLVLDVARR